MSETALEGAVSLVDGFAERTGLTADRPPRRYLWTDAFAVCNCLELSRRTEDGRWTELALRLVDQVHRVLGRHRPDDPRRGWISGLDEREGEAHPTCGGLRIGKPLPERPPGEPLDERLEWERDGQYFHYLTKWMHALDQVSSATGDPRFNLWARELARAAHKGFTHGPPGGGARRLFWKMSTDLSRPLVPSMGQHDPLDGFITCVQLEATAARLRSRAEGPDLGAAVSDLAAMARSSDVRTADPLGLGGILSDAARVSRLVTRGILDGGRLLETLLVAAQEGLAVYSRREEWRKPAERRLAFRELGLAIGLSAVELIRDGAGGRPGSRGTRALEALAAYRELGQAIGSFWLDPGPRMARSWGEHRDINEVMLATSLVPEGYLDILPEA